jgi:hypothetical protein
MAKSKGSGGGGARVNKSAAIREMIGQHPEARSKEIIRLLAEKGLKVRPTLVYYIRSKEKHLKRQDKRQRAASLNAGVGSPVQLIIKVKELSKQAGGIRNLKQLVDILAE